MKTLTVALIACIMYCFTVTVVKAQDAKTMLKESTPEQRAQLQTTLMKNKLGLDSTQVAKVQAINLKSAQKLDPVLKSDGRKLKMMRDVMAIQKEKDADLKQVLTPAQYKQYETMKDDMKQHLMDARQNK